ncbi:unnamed protein product [Tetraodon nigroviridis]|uniref:(spotted green pufferfish) hypothetical protein n=1 Tax=Tetraodon nigroviridis TaxID=99883 RepID=Q4RNV5_TETNG|nr:unnamed protein product [Tetraodon nigroviridis]
MARRKEGRTRTAEGPGRRVYTVLPPPADYQADSERSSTLLQRESTSDKNTAGESRDDADKDSEQDGEKEQTSRRRKRRKKKPALRPDCEKDEADPASQPSAAPGQAHGGVSKNKKRKLKKKRRKEQLLSMGLVPKAAAVEFTYSEDGESGSGVAEVSDFLRSTMKLYMSDGK